MTKIILVLIIIANQSSSYCQLNIGEKPYSMVNTSWQFSIPVTTTPTLNMTAVNADDIADSIANQPPDDIDVRR